LTPHNTNTAKPESQRPTFAPDPRTPWLGCDACGRWSRQTRACPACGWSALSRNHDGDAIRVLLDLDVYGDVCEVSRIYSARWPEWAGAVSALSGALDLQGVRDHVAAKRCLPDVAHWERLARRARARLEERLSGRLVGTGDPEVWVSLRIRILDLDISDAEPKDRPAWLTLTPPEVISATAAETLGIKHLKVEPSRPLSLAIGARETMLLFTSERDVLLTRIQAASGPDGKDGRGRADIRCRVVLRAGQPTPVALPWTLAEAHAFVKDHEERPDSIDWLVLYFHGRNDPLGLRVSPLPRTLPNSAKVANVHLDIGSTVSKLMLADGAGRAFVHRTVGTDRFALDLGVRPYAKKAFLENPDDWAAWVREALPGIQQEAAHHGHYLGDVHLCLPGTADVDVQAFSARIGSIASHAVGQVRLHTEPALLHAHFLQTLGELRVIGARYVKQAAEAEQAANQRDAERTAHAARLKEWEARTRFGRWWHTNPGASPAELARLPRPADWMTQLTHSSDRLQRVVLLDAGGLSLDVAVEENGTLIPLLSMSLRCGGEDISEAMGLERGFKSTNHKVGLALRFAPNARLDSQLSQYREATRRVCAPFSALAARISERWGGALSLAIVTGGGARNPFFIEFVKEALGPAAWIVSDDDIAAYIRSFGDFGVHDRGSVTARFLKVRSWNEDGPPELLYDKFAIVGGMWAS
jgi:hypothetical protein